MACLLFHMIPCCGAFSKKLGETSVRSGIQNALATARVDGIQGLYENILYR